MRIFAVNTHRYNPVNEKRMSNLTKAIRDYDIDILILNEVNTQ